MSSPRLEPWLMPETISSGWDSTSPRAAKRTQSTGVPSVAKPVVPSANSISSTQSGLRVVMLRAVALLFESGAITARSTPGTSSSARRMAPRPIAWMPSSFVKRIFTRPLKIESSAGPPAPRPDAIPRPPPSVFDRFQIEAVGRRCVTRLFPGATVEQPGELLRACAQHRADERAHHVAHEGIRLDPEGEHLAGLLHPLGPQHVPLEADVVGLGRGERGEVVRAEGRGGAFVEGAALQRAWPVQRVAALERAVLPAALDAIAVGPAARVATSVEAVGGGLAGEHPDVGRQHSVERVG